ncbi:unnamed protein product [Vicia faba]|uniref:Uncharacterized protein n=1 Tax=Vicia faba TaxID=3906 RepID=A0AAV0ZKJ1_VICFA|nr:unnamed protein product [Vicia faba]
MKKTKSKKLAAKEDSSELSLKNVICSKKKLDGEVSELKNNLVVTSGTYFGHAKEQVSFFFPSLDLGMLDIFKIIHDGQLMDEEEASAAEHLGSPPATCAQDGPSNAIKGGRLTTPHLEEIPVKEATLKNY